MDDIEPSEPDPIADPIAGDWHDLPMAEVDPNWEHPIEPNSPLAAFERRFKALATHDEGLSQERFFFSLQIFTLLFNLKTAVDDNGDLISVKVYNEIVRRYVGKSTAAESFRLNMHQHVGAVTTKMLALRNQWHGKHPDRPYRYPKINVLMDWCRAESDPKHERLRRNRPDAAIREENRRLQDQLVKHQERIDELVASEDALKRDLHHARDAVAEEIDTAVTQVTGEQREIVRQLAAELEQAVAEIASLKGVKPAPVEAAPVDEPEPPAKRGRGRPNTGPIAASPAQIELLLAIERGDGTDGQNKRTVTAAYKKDWIDGDGEKLTRLGRMALGMNRSPEEFRVRDFTAQARAKAAAEKAELLEALRNRKKASPVSLSKAEYLALKLIYNDDDWAKVDPAMKAALLEKRLIRGTDRDPETTPAGLDALERYERSGPFV
jgi:hypothetical protein